MTDQKKASADQKAPSPLSPEQRRRMREAAKRHLPHGDARGCLAGLLAVALDALEQAERERDDAIRSKDSTQQWYAERLQRLRKMAEERGFLTEYCCIVANGVGDIHEPPTYAQILNQEKHRRKDAERERDALREKLAAAERRVTELEDEAREQRYVAMEDAERG